MFIHFWCLSLLAEQTIPASHQALSGSSRSLQLKGDNVVTAPFRPPQKPVGTPALHTLPTPL